MRSTPEGLAAEPGKSGTIVWVMRSPYPYVNARLKAEGSGFKFELSKDNKTWTDVSNGVLDTSCRPRAPWNEFRLRCQLEGAARLKGLHFVGNLQWRRSACPK